MWRLLLKVKVKVETQKLLILSFSFLLVSIFALDSTSVKEEVADADVDNSNDIEAGDAINIFMRYGYLSICMRVIPRNDTDQWIFREPTVKIFQRDEEELVFRNGKEGDLIFNMELCDNLKQLLQAYFRDFSFEGLQFPWRAFSAGWPNEVLAKNMGLNGSYVNGDFAYILIRFSVPRQGRRLRNHTLDSAAATALAAPPFEPGDLPAVLDFIRKYGSHYIHHFVTGDSLYQVFVYSRPVYMRIKERLRAKHSEELSLSELANYFSPWYADHIGQIKLASNNRTVLDFAVRNLKVDYYIFSYPSLLKLRSDSSLISRLDKQMGNSAILKLELKSLQGVFDDDERRKWFTEVLDNYLKLWESNM